MSKIIETYYKQANVMPLLLKQKMLKLQRNTAKSLSELSKYTDGEAAFMLLIELRETPEKTLRRIKNGFKIK